MANFTLPVSRFCDYGGLIASLLEIHSALLIDNQTYGQISERERRLKRLGIPAYSLYWLSGGYLCRAYPKTATRPRRREYVGIRPEKQKKTIEAVERRQQYERLQREKAAIERRAERVASALSRISKFIREQT